MSTRGAARTLHLTATVLIVLCLLGLGGVTWLLLSPSELNVPLVLLSLFIVGLLLFGLLATQLSLGGVVKQTAAAASNEDNAQFLSLYERSPTALLTVDAKSTIVSYNPAAVKMLGSTTDELQQINFIDLVAAYPGHDPSVLASKIRGGITLNEEEIELTTFNGQEVWALMSVYVEAANDYRIISLVDVTQAKKIDNAKTEFVALATHQLRTPSAAIRWNTELLSRKLHQVSPAELEPYLAKINRNTLRMIALIDDFLSVSKLEMGTFATADEEVNVAALFAETLDEYDGKITKKQINVTTNTDPPDVTITSDGRLLNIIVTNLVSNAVKYLQTGGDLTLGYQTRSDRLLITVADNGIGIPRHEQEQLFKRFFRASNARSHETEGTGLGLYIVKQSVEQLGGTIEVSSAEGAGSTFTVTLPV